MKKNGFTLLELMIVVIIVGILAGLAMPMFQGATIKAKFPEMFAAVRRIEFEVDVVVAEKGWPPSTFTVEMALKNKEGFGWIGGAAVGSLTTDKFEYNVQNYPGADPAMCNIVVYPIEVPAPSLCWKSIFQDGERTWTIKDSHPWAKYLNIPGAIHE